MAIEDYGVTVRTSGGVKKFYIETLTRLDMTLIASGVGVVALEFPALSDRQSFTIDQFEEDDRIEVRRQDQLLGEAPYLLRYKDQLHEKNAKTITLQAFHANCLLEDREIAYYAGHAQAEATAERCDNAMKRIVSYNLGANAQNADRDSTIQGITAPDLSAYLTVASDTSQAPTTTKAFARQFVMGVLQDLAQDSYEQGTPLFFGFRLDEETGLLTFETSAHQWGENRTGTILSPDLGNLENTREIWDWRGKKTVAYALGSDEGVNRNIKAYRSEDYNSSVFAFREATVDVRSMSSADSLTNEAKSYVKARQGKRYIEGELVQQIGSRFQEDWGWGDKLPVKVDGIEYQIWINKMTLNVSQQDETIKPELEIVQ